MQLTKVPNRRYLPSRPTYRAEYTPPPQTRIWDVLMVHNKAFFGSIVLCTVLAVLYSLSSTPEFQARGSLELETPTSSSFSGRDGDAQTAINGPTFDSYLETQIGILQSDTLIRRVITRLNLAQRMQAYRPQGLVALRNKYLSSGNHIPTPEEVFDNTKNNLVVRQSRLNNLIEVLYSAPDAKLASDFVNTLADEYQQQNLETRWQSSQSAGNWFTRHLTDLRSQLEASENALQNYSRANGLLLVNDDGSVAKERLSQLQEALSKAQSDRMTKQAQMEMAANSSPDSVPEVVDNAALKEYEVRISDLERQLAEYKQIYTPANTKVQIVQSQIAALQAAFGKQQSSVLARVSNDYKTALRNESMLSAAYATQAKVVTDQDEKMIRYETLKHEVDTNRTTYESLLQKVKESSVNVALQATNVRVVDSAVPPLHPYKPNHLVDIGGGIMAGLILGMTLVAVQHRSDRRVRRPGVIQHYLTTRELGVIPSNGRLASGRHNIRSIGPGGLRGWLDDPNSLLSTSFRSVMTSIVFATKGPSRARLAVITSPGPGEGKTTIASNLAAAFAATGRRVLIVDADLRRSRLHKIFELPDCAGLREFAAELHAGNSSEDAIEQFVQPTTVPGLFVMPSGKEGSPDAPNLLYTLRFEEVFASLRSRFDTILIDAPPILAVPEVRVMARLADGVVLVIRAGSTRVDDVMAAENFIREDGGTVLGTVLNDAPQSSTPYYGGYAPIATV